MNYNPAYRNDHIVQLTLNDNGFIGHIRFIIGGNCKGMSILESGLNWIDTCDEDDIDRCDNDCNFEMTFDEENDEYLFSFVLNNGTETNSYEDYTDDDFKNMIVAVEIIDCKPDEDD